MDLEGYSEIESAQSHKIIRIRDNNVFELVHEGQVDELALFSCACEVFIISKRGRRSGKALQLHHQTGGKRRGIKIIRFVD